MKFRKTFEIRKKEYIEIQQNGYRLERFCNLTTVNIMLSSSPSKNCGYSTRYIHILKMTFSSIKSSISVINRVGRFWKRRVSVHGFDRFGWIVTSVFNGFRNTQYKTANRISRDCLYRSTFRTLRKYNKL